MKFKDTTFLKEKNRLLLFYPYISKRSYKNIVQTIDSRWVGQGPKVDLFEKKFSKMFLGNDACLATGSGTDSLHLAYILSNIKKDDEVIVPVFTCTATNIPLLYIGAKIKFADIDANTLNISVESAEKLITKKTKAIVCVHYGGLPCDMDGLKKLAKKYNLILIEDAAQAIGAKYGKEKIGTIGDFSAFSFQAIKHITTGDGGLLSLKSKKHYAKGKRIRWFGIDREKKYAGTWANDIYEVGYKYQMTDISATLGIDGLNDFKKILKHRRKIYYLYLKLLSKNKKIRCVHDYDKKKYHSAWLFTILLDQKDYLQKKLREKNVETNQVHFRNDKYSIFKKFAKKNAYPNMDSIEDKYLVLPLHHKITVSDVKYICSLINKYI